MPRIPIVDTIIYKNNKVLMVRRNFEPGKGKLDLPGGFVDNGETVEEAAIREAKEETGLTVELVEKLGEFDYFDRQEKTSHAFVTKILSGDIKESVEGKPLWVNINNIKESDLSFPSQFIPILNVFRKSKYYISAK